MKQALKLVLGGLLVLCAAAPANAGEVLTYKDGDTVLEGYFARTDAPAPAPVVLIVHQWKGLTDYEKMRADMLAAEGYNAFAIDMYGKGIRPATNEEAGAEATKYKDDPALARRRLGAAIDLIRGMSSVGPRIAIMGYCFGGTMALEAARMGAPLEGAISFHGGLSTLAPAKPGAVTAAVMVHHGADDPLVPPREVTLFEHEMHDAGVTALDFFAYPGAVHAFTQKDAGHDPTTGVAYNAEADQLSWTRTLSFLQQRLKGAATAKP